MTLRTFRLHIIFSIFLLVGSNFIYAQTFQNGSFENTTAPNSCQYNLSNSAFNSFMSSVNAFGSGNECDILITGCNNPSIPNGIRAVGIAHNPVDEIALSLTLPLSIGNSYTISFWSYSSPSRPQGDIEIGSSATNNSFGTPIYTATTIASTWVNHTFTFIAPNNSQFITVRNVIDGAIHWNHIDNFEFSCLPNLDLGNDTTLCQGETLILDATTTYASYIWQDNSTNPTFNVTQQGTYWVQITDSCGSTTDTINVSYYPLLTLDLGNDTTICQGETLILDATTTNASYIWQDNSTNPTFNVTQQGTYWVEVTVNNCSTTDSILTIEEDCEIILEMPNVFTPNNDGINDLFVPIISIGIVSMNTIIYNRWGNEIYETNNLLIEWNGQDVSDGTYFWIVYYTDKNGIYNSLKGFVTILK